MQQYLFYENGCCKNPTRALFLENDIMTFNLEYLEEKEGFISCFHLTGKSTNYTGGYSHAAFRGKRQKDYFFSTLNALIIYYLEDAISNLSLYQDQAKSVTFLQKELLKYTQLSLF